jgi:hypothetical protein
VVTYAETLPSLVAVTVSTTRDSVLVMVYVTVADVAAGWPGAMDVAVDDCGPYAGGAGADGDDCWPYAGGAAGAAGAGGAAALTATMATSAAMVVENRIVIWNVTYEPLKSVLLDVVWVWI